MGEPKIEYFRRSDDKWAWSLHAGNGQVVANDASQGYENKSDCVESARKVVTGFYAAAREVWS